MYRCKSKYGVQNMAQATWESFEECLLSASGFDGRGIAAHSKLDKLRQAAYTREFKLLASRVAEPTPLSEADKIHHFRNGLRPQLRAVRDKA